MHCEIPSHAPKSWPPEVELLLFDSSLWMERSQRRGHNVMIAKMSEAERKARAAARRARGVTMERVDPGEPARPHDDRSIEARMTAMTLLCRAAWRATGKPFPAEGRAHRASMPGEVYWPERVLRNKRAAARHKDLDDAEWLEGAAGADESGAER